MNLAKAHKKGLLYPMFNSSSYSNSDMKLFMSAHFIATPDPPTSILSSSRITTSYIDIEP